jgi:hypothetical protein
MNLVIDTERISDWEIKAKYSSAGPQGWFLPNFGDYFKNLSNIQDVIVVLNFTSLETDFSSRELTYLASQMSESSLAEAWIKEDDNYWNSYLE